MAKGYKTGGRKKGTPNKNNPIKEILANHSVDYFTRRVQTDRLTGNAREIQRARMVLDKDGNVKKILDLVPLTDSAGFPLNLSDFEVDMFALDPAERVSAELKILEFHTPRMKSQDINMEMTIGPRTIEDKLKALCNGDDEEDEE